MTAQFPEDSIHPASHRVAKGLGTTLIARLGAVVEIVAQPLYVLMFGLAGYGLYAVLWAAINLVENILDLGMASALQRMVPQSADDVGAAVALRTALILGVLPCIIFAGGVFVAAPTIAPMVNVAARDVDAVVPAIQLFIWALPLWAFVEIATAALRARLMFGPEIRLKIMWEQILRLVLAVLFWALGWGLLGLIAAHLCSLFITALLCLGLLRKNYALPLIFVGPLWPPVAGDTALAGLSVLPANIIGRLFGDAPALVLNQMLPGAAGATAAGLWLIARKLSSLVQMTRVAFVYVLAPLSASSERRDRAEVREVYAYAVRLIFVLAVPLAFTLASGSGPLLALFGPDAQVATAAVIILFFARAIEAVCGIAQPVLQVVAAFRHQVTASVFGLAIALLAGWALTDMLTPLTLVTLAVSLGFVIAAAFAMAQLWWIEQMHPFTAAFWRLAAITLVASSGGALLAAAASTLPGALALCLIAASSAAAIWASMRFGLGPEDRTSLGSLGRGLKLI